MATYRDMFSFDNALLSLLLRFSEKVGVFSGLTTRTSAWDHILSRRSVEFGRWDDGRFILDLPSMAGWQIEMASKGCDRRDKPWAIRDLWTYGRRKGLSGAVWWDRSRKRPVRFLGKVE